MESTSESLEERLDEKPDWKQWIPVYGIYQIKRDLDEGKPTFNMSNIYHAVSTVAIAMGTYIFYTN